MNRFKVIHSVKARAYFVTDTLTGKCYLETENEVTANNKANELNFYNNI